MTDPEFGTARERLKQIEGRHEVISHFESLTMPELAKLLELPEKQIQNDFELMGAPTNADGTINLFHYTAWLIKEQSVWQ